MNYPKEIWADTDLVCSEEPSESKERYVRADEHTKLFEAVSNLVQIVEGVRNVPWKCGSFRLNDTPEWCALYTAWSRDMTPDAKPANGEVSHE